jgi:hypothetical protein
MSELDTIVKAIDKISEAQALQTQGILKCIEANAIVTNKDVNDIKKHLADMNGTVATLKKLSDERGLVVNEFHEHQKFGKWVHKNWWVVLLIFIVSVTLIVSVVDALGVRGMWNVVKEVKGVL